MTTKRCEICTDHQYTDFIILPGELQAMCPWCVYQRYEKLLARIETLETELEDYERRPPQKMPSFRCESVNAGLGTRCVRRGGHALKHAYPNRLMKKMNREFWEALQDPKSTLNVDELGDRLAFTFVEPFADENG